MPPSVCGGGLELCTQVTPGVLVLTRPQAAWQHAVVSGCGRPDSMGPWGQLSSGPGPVCALVGGFLGEPPCEESISVRVKGAPR